MLASIGIVMVAVLISIKEVPSLWGKGWKKELWVFSILLLLGTGISIAEALDKDIPNPLDWIAFIYKPFSDFILELLK